MTALIAASSTYGTTGFVSSHPIPYPSGIQAGHLLVVLASPHWQYNVFDVPADWTSLHAHACDNLRSHQAFAKVADGTESGTLDLSTAPQNRHVAAIMLRITDWDSSAGIAAIAAAGSPTHEFDGTVELDPTTSGLTDPLILRVPRTKPGYTLTNPAGVTQVVEALAASGAGLRVCTDTDDTVQRTFTFAAGEEDWNWGLTLSIPSEVAIAKTVTGSVTAASTLQRKVIKPLARTVTPDAALARWFARTATIARTVTPAGDHTLTGRNRLVTRTVTPTGVLTRALALARSISRTVPPAPELARGLTLSRSFSATVTPTTDLFLLPTVTEAPVADQPVFAVYGQHGTFGLMEHDRVTTDGHTFRAFPVRGWVDNATQHDTDGGVMHGGGFGWGTTDRSDGPAVGWFTQAGHRWRVLAAPGPRGVNALPLPVVDVAPVWLGGTPAMAAILGDVYDGWSIAEHGELPVYAVFVQQGGGWVADPARSRTAAELRSGETFADAFPQTTNELGEAVTEARRPVAVTALPGSGHVAVAQAGPVPVAVSDGAALLGTLPGSWYDAGSTAVFDQRVPSQTSGSDVADRGSAGGVMLAGTDTPPPQGAVFVMDADSEVATWLELPTTTHDGLTVRVEPFAVYATAVPGGDRLTVLVRRTVETTGEELPAALMELAYDTTLRSLAAIGGDTLPDSTLGPGGEYVAGAFLADGRLALAVNEHGAGVYGVEVRTAPVDLATATAVSVTSSSLETTGAHVHELPAVGIAAAPSGHLAAVLADAHLIVLSPGQVEATGTARTVTASAAGPPIRVEGLQPGQMYEVVARAVNEAGGGDASEPVYFTPELDELDVQVMVIASLSRLSPGAEAVGAHLDAYTNLLYVPLSDGARQWMGVYDLAQLGLPLPAGLERDLPADPHTPTPLRPIDPPEATYRPGEHPQHRPGAVDATAPTGVTAVGDLGPEPEPEPEPEPAPAVTVYDVWHDEWGTGQTGTVATFAPPGSAGRAGVLLVGGTEGQKSNADALAGLGWAEMVPHHVTTWGSTEVYVRDLDGSADDSPDVSGDSIRSVAIVALDGTTAAQLVAGAWTEDSSPPWPVAAISGPAGSGVLAIMLTQYEGRTFAVPANMDEVLNPAKKYRRQLTVGFRAWAEGGSFQADDFTQTSGPSGSAAVTLPLVASPA